jgi:hypothetical protein
MNETEASAGRDDQCNRCRAFFFRGMFWPEHCSYRSVVFLYFFERRERLAAGEMTSGLFFLRRSNLSALIIRRKGLYAGLRRDISSVELVGRISSSAASCTHVLVFQDHVTLSEFKAMMSQHGDTLRGLELGFTGPDIPAEFQRQPGRTNRFHQVRQTLIDIYKWDFE